jgi:HSP20 family molecular chaperone IbpA
LAKRVQSLELRDDASPPPREISIRSTTARKEATMPVPTGPKTPPIDIAELRDHVEDALDHWFAGPRGWLPAVDLIRSPSEVMLRADVPGVKSDDLRIEVDGDTLTISGERREPDAAGERSYLREERRRGPFSRSFALPGRIDAAKVDAGLRDGILEVTLPLRPGGSDKEPVRIRPTQ